MFTFDRWLQSTHPEILKQYFRRPKAERHFVLWDWMKEKYSKVLRDEWAAAAKAPENYVSAADEHV